MLGTRAISTTSRRELSSSFFFLQGKAPKEIDAILIETLACFLPGRAKDLAAPLFFRTRLNRQLPLAVCTPYQQRTHAAARCNIPTPLPNIATPLPNIATPFIFVNVRLKDFSVGYAVSTPPPKKNTLYGNPKIKKKIGNDYHFNRP